MQDNKKRTLWITIALLVVAVVLAITGFVQRGNVQRQLDEAKAENTALVADVAAKDELSAQVSTITADLEVAKAELDAAKAESESLKTSLSDTISEMQGQADALAAERENIKAQLEAAVSPEAAQALSDDLNGQITSLKGSLENAQADAKTAWDEVDKLRTEAETTRGELETARVNAQAVQTELDTVRSNEEGLIADLDGVRAELDTLREESQTLAKDLDTARAALEKAQDIRHGLGLVTSAGDVTAASGDKPGSALVKTTIASVVLDSENRILAVKWDVQQTQIQFTAEGLPVHWPEDELARLADDQAFGLRASPDAEEVWVESLDELQASLIGKTVDEALAMENFGPEAYREDLMEALRRASDNPK
ncbi:MAG: hypothetical protein PHP02_07080 [Eubacteriales bacterium]|nr:hypothetical protein [Eubacteriales bacterium]